MQEADILSSLRHDHIILLLQVEHSIQHLGLVMELAVVVTCGAM